MLKLLTILLIFSYGGSAAQYNLEYFRSQFHTNSTEENLQRLIDLEPTEVNLTNIKIIDAYKAVCETMMANYAFRPTMKLKYFHTGTKELEAIISEKPLLEVIYLRLLVQLSVPKMLNYSSDIESDLTFVKSNFKSTALSENDKELFKNSLLKATKNPAYLSTINTI